MFVKKKSACCTFYNGALAGRLREKKKKFVMLFNFKLLLYVNVLKMSLTELVKLLLRICFEIW